MDYTGRYSAGKYRREGFWLSHVGMLTSTYGPFNADSSTAPETKVCQMRNCSDRATYLGLCQCIVSGRKVAKYVVLKGQVGWPVRMAHGFKKACTAPYRYYSAPVLAVRTNTMPVMFVYKILPKLHIR